MVDLWHLCGRLAILTSGRDVSETDLRSLQHMWTAVPLKWVLVTHSYRSDHIAETADILRTVRRAFDVPDGAAMPAFLVVRRTS